MSWLRVALLILQYAPTLIDIFARLFKEVESLPKPVKQVARRDLKASLSDAKRLRTFAGIDQLRSRIDEFRA